MENQQTYDMSSHHCSNDENKENSNDAMEPSRAWIKNVGPGSCKMLPFTTGTKPKLSHRRKTSKTSKTTKTARKLITTTETVVHHIDVDNTAIMEAEAHSTMIETIDISCEIVEADTSCSESSAMQTNAIATNTDDTEKLFNDVGSGLENLAKEIGSTPVTGTSETNQLTLERTHLDWTLVAPTQATNQVHKMYQVHMTEEDVNEFLRGGLITIHNGELYYKIVR